MLAKGYHFANLTLVGIIDADSGLAGVDLRAPEKQFQLLTQVAGRSGREAKKPGTVLVQTYNQEHPVIAALINNDAKALLAEEIAARRRLKMPPFAWLAGIIVFGPEVDKVLASVKLMAQQFPCSEVPGIELLGPSPAPLYKLRGNYRYRFLLKTARSINIQDVINQWLGQSKLPAGISLRIDINPYSFM
jgi:primosomal protein N' (replication factor Y)